MRSTRIRSIGVFLVFASLTLALVAAADSQGEKGKGKGKGKAKDTAQVEFDKLPVGLARYLRDHAAASKGGKGKKKDGFAKAEQKKKDKKGKKKDDDFAKAEEKKKDKKGEGKKKDKMAEASEKSISLVDAIGIAEKSGYGTAVKGEVKGAGDSYLFKIDLLSRDGTKTKVHLDSRGRAIAEEPKKKDSDKKGKGKKKKDRDEED